MRQKDKDWVDKQLWAVHTMIYRTLRHLEDRVSKIDARTAKCHLCGDWAVEGTEYKMPSGQAVPWCGKCRVVDENIDDVNIVVTS